MQHPISLFDAGLSNGKVSLAEVFKGNFIEDHKDIDLHELADSICVGCWTEKDEDISKYYRSLISNMIAIDGIKHDPDRAKQVLRSFARYVGTDATSETIRKDILKNNQGSFSQNTFYDYLQLYKQLGVIEDVPAWLPSLTSKGVIRLSDTHYFSDPSIATAALGLRPKDLIWDLQIMTKLFKNFCIRDLRAYAKEIGGKVYHFKDSYGLECDAVIQLENGKYGLIQIVLGGTEHFQQAASSLLKFSKRIDQTKMKAPSFLMVLNGVNAPFAYKREDGVLMVPVFCLKA